MTTQTRSNKPAIDAREGVPCKVLSVFRATHRKHPQRFEILLAPNVAACIPLLANKLNIPKNHLDQIRMGWTFEEIGHEAVTL